MNGEAKMKPLLILALVGLTAAFVSYDGYHLIDLVPNTDDDVQFLRGLLIEDEAIDFWEEPSKVGKNVRMLLDGQYLEFGIAPLLANRGLTYQVVHGNFEEVIEQERQDIASRRAKRDKAFDLEDFNTFADIEVWLSDQLVTCSDNGHVCSLTSLGQSVEGREIWLFTMSSTVGVGKPVIYSDSIIHAREWIASATTLKVMNHLLTNYYTDLEVRTLMDEHELHFVPIVNPDGYEETWIDDRLWRKNKGDNPGFNCTGTDLNRNFDQNWGENGVSYFPCSGIYCGASAGNQPETQAISAHLQAIGSNTWAMLTFHSYAYDWMHPWGVTIQPYNDTAPCKLAEHHDSMYAVSEAAGLAVEATYGQDWDIGNGCIAIYPTSGSTDDYAYGRCGVIYSFTIELRGVSFIIDPSHIDPSFREIWAGINAMKHAIDADPPF